jgi:2-alkyl-3-oxoalkanoate reductase
LVPDVSPRTLELNIPEIRSYDEHFLAGATGAVGKRLVPLLVSSGHHVVATTRSSERAESLRAAASEAIIVDGLDRNALITAVRAARRDVIVHQMTALASMRSLKKFDDEFALTNRLRTEGTEYFLEGAGVAGTRKALVHSYAGWPSGREGSRVKREEDRQFLAKSGDLNSSPPSVYF